MNTPKKPRLLVLKDSFTIHRLNPTDKFPEVLFNEKYFWAGKTDSELSIVCRSDLQINSAKKDENWIAIKLDEVMDFSVVGVIAGVSRVLAEADISIFAISTFDTDYILVKAGQLGKALQVLGKAGYDCHYE